MLGREARFVDILGTLRTGGAVPLRTVQLCALLCVDSGTVSIALHGSISWL